MPKITFEKLTQEKKRRIETSICKEFLAVPFEEASIKHIVEEAGIPRGSFYQYFEDKEDAFLYVIQQQMEPTKQEMNQYRADEDIFKCIEQVFVREMHHLQRDEKSIKTDLLRQITKSTWAMNLFTNTLMETVRESIWFNDWIEGMSLDSIYIEAFSELLINTLKEAMIGLLNQANDLAHIHHQLHYKLEIIQRGIEHKRHE